MKKIASWLAAHSSFALALSGASVFFGVVLSCPSSGLFATLPLGFCFFSLLVPAGLRLFAWIWYSLSQCLGSIVLTIILTISFIFLVLPVGLCQRLFGRNSMGLKDWHGKGSLLHDRNYTYSKKDFEKTW